MDGHTIDGTFSHPQQSCTVSVPGANMGTINDRTAASLSFQNGACAQALMVHSYRSPCLERSKQRTRSHIRANRPQGPLLANASMTYAPSGHHPASASSPSACSRVPAEPLFEPLPPSADRQRVGRGKSPCRPPLTLV